MNLQLADVFRGSNFKAFYICCALVTFQQFSGINAVLFYMTTIFRAAGATLEPDIATIIIGVVQVLIFVRLFYRELIPDGNFITYQPSLSLTSIYFLLSGLYVLQCIR